MNRIIKFRAWDIKRKDMVYFWTERNTGDHSLAIRPCITLEGKFFGVSQYSNVGAEELSDHEWRFMQFTGLHDKNGKEIYEGDVVQCSFADGASKRGEISFVDGSFDVCFYQHRDYLKCFVVNHAIEIIGNIYENPELLKEQHENK